jgi:thiamine pyrophosphokinase
MKIKKIVIVCSGEDYSEKKLIAFCKKSDFIISVDGGLNILDKIKIKPSCIIGDMDSVDKKLLHKYESVQTELYPADKDFTDSELAIKKAISFFPEIISIFSGTGSYFDHSFANLINLFKYLKHNIQMEIITGNSKIFPVFKEIKILNHAGRRFSIFPVEKTEGIEMQGCKYEFKNKKNLKIFDYSISNVITEKEMKIKIKKGLMFCVLFDEGYK